MEKQKRTIDAFFKRKNVDKLDISPHTTSSSMDSIKDEPQPSKIPRIEQEFQESDKPLERDPGLRRQICEYPIALRDEIRRAYIKKGPYQVILSDYPRSGSEKHLRRFQSTWFKLFHWLEYSPTKDAAFCFPCFLFSKKPLGRPGSNAFTIEGFRNWKKVNDGKKCAFLNHVGVDPCSPHNIAVQSCDDLINQTRHIDKVMNAQTSEQIYNNRLRLKTSIDSIRWLTLQGCAYRGHDESQSSRNRGNFIEVIKLLATYNEEVAKVVLENAPGNAKYIAPSIQKEILHILSNKVKDKIRKDLGEAKFCIMVDEARDESKREQVALVLRFVDIDGYIRERFFTLFRVNDTTSLTLKEELSSVLAHHNLNISDIRGQGYDGASNMRGEWNGLQALFLHECPTAYYIHCFAHRLQLALVAASRDIIPIHQFFSKLVFVINIITASCKRNSELKNVQAIEIAQLIDMDELETGKGANQVDILCQALQKKSQDILNAIQLVSSTKEVIQKLREEGWDALLESVKLFCDKYEIDIPDMNAQYIKGRGRVRRQDHVTIEHHYRIDIFTAAIDSQLYELNNRFSEKSMELLVLSSALDPKENYKAFNIDSIYKLAEKFYPQDFTEKDLIHLQFQLQHYKLDVPHHPDLKSISTISKLCRGLVETGKSKVYYLIDRLIRLVLTLPVSTATTERAFSAMKIVKTRLRNKMEDEFLADYLSVYIEREISETFSSESIIDDFYAMKDRRAQL